VGGLHSDRPRFLYLVAIMDWRAGRCGAGACLSNTLDASFCVAALEEALQRLGKPRIFNTDQGSQFTSMAFTGPPRAGIQISMEGRRRWMDNVFIERLWRCLEHEDVYLKGYADGRELHQGLSNWIAFYNNRRPHQALSYRTPMAVWRNGTAAQALDMVDNARALPTMPTAPTTAADRLTCSVISGVRNGRVF
jgi:putative transposase